MTVYTVIDRPCSLNIHIHTHNMELTLKTLYIYSEHTHYQYTKKRPVNFTGRFSMNTPIFLYIV